MVEAIIIFILLSLSAAGRGDYSGIAVIGKVVGFFLLFFAIAWLFSHPVLVLTIIAGIVIYGIHSAVK